MNAPAAPSPSHTKCLAAARLWSHRLLSFSTVLMVLLFVYTALKRLRSPFAFDQVEGSFVTSVWRLAHGLPVYTRPTLDFVPHIYAPVYLYLCAFLSHYLGDGYLALRLVSIVSALGGMALIALLVRRETGLTWPGLAAAGIYAACYRPLQGWFDIGRVDSLFIFLLILAIYCTRFAPPLVTAIVWLLAFQTKQVALPIALVAILAGYQRPRRAITTLALTAALVIASILWMNHITGGWYGFWLFGSSGSLPFVFRMFILFLPTGVLLPLSVALLLILAALFLAPPRATSEATRFYTFVSVATFFSIWYFSAHAGAAVNTLMPLYAWIAILAGIAIARLYRRIQSAPLESPVRDALLALLFAAASLQMLGHFYQTGLFVPGPDVLNSRRAFQSQLAAVPGDIYLISHSYDAILAGKQPHADLDAFNVVTNAHPSTLRSQFLDSFHVAIDNRLFAGFVLDGDASTYNPGPDSWMPADFEQQYPVRILAAGALVRPTPDQPVEKWIYLPCSALTPALAPVLDAAPAVSYGSCPHLSQLAAPVPLDRPSQSLGKPHFYLIAKP